MLAYAAGNFRIAQYLQVPFYTYSGELAVFCAALVGAHRRGLTERGADVELDGGTLDITWREDGHVIMTGPAMLSFEGAFDTALLAAG